MCGVRIRLWSWQRELRSRLEGVVGVVGNLRLPGLSCIFASNIDSPDGIFSSYWWLVLRSPRSASGPSIDWCHGHDAGTWEHGA